MICWMRKYTSPGLAFDDPYWLPEDDVPEIADSIRAPWLDEPEVK